MTEIHPPKWADRFLAWYCNPDLLEEIQGDAWQLYFERLRTEGKASADRRYIWDVIRFCRWSNIKKPGNKTSAAARGALWNFNFKLAVRNAGKNKIIFGIKTTGLSLCLAFSLILTAYIINELTFDEFHDNHDRIYRVVSTVQFPDHTTHYAITPLPLGKALAEGIPEVESYFRFMFDEKAVFHLNEKIFSNEKTFAADSNFLRILSFDFVYGSTWALDEPNKIVLTETLARKFFGEENPLGQTIEFGQDMLLEVSAVIKDIPPNSHLKFDALISWDSFNHYDAWGNLNAYTYILLKDGAKIDDVRKKMPALLATFHDLIARDYHATYEPVFENISDIHFSQPLDEDIADKRNKTNIFILLAVIILFLITGLVNYLNLTLTELTANLKKIGIIRVFGGLNGGHHKILFSDVLLTLLIVGPMVALFVYSGWEIARSYLSININPRAVSHPLFTGLIASFFALMIASSKFNALILSRAGHVVGCLQGKLNKKESGTNARKILVCIQLSFSIIIIALITIIVDQFRFIQDADKGFDDKNTLVIKLPRDEPRTIEQFTEEIRSIPGISGADGSSYYPGIIESKYVFEVETEKGMQQMLVPMIRCGYDYMKTLSIKTSEGRSFESNNDSDQYNAFMINETAAREFGWQNAVGKKIRGPLSGDNEAYREGNVIGVTEDFNFTSLHNRIEPVIFFLTDETWGSQFIYAKLDPIRPENLIATIEGKFKDQWPEHPFDWEYLNSKYLSLYKKDYEVKNIFEIGLVISIVISCLGIFSISALTTVLRIKEMGIRKVLGATGAQLFYLHVKNLLYFTLIAVMLAVPVIWFAGDLWLQNFAYHVQINQKYFILPGVIALLITVITSGYHGMKGGHVNLVKILKHE